ncbi:MAG TPA: S-layer homology domain-containing protein [Pseudobacteroides sp.]|uniref:S-layer homology domain-containing protein n=1 Tax=Pseudobacteroides sp. TaxID=1968840 RepID=UPI002F920F3D
MKRFLVYFLSLSLFLNLLPLNQTWTFADSDATVIQTKQTDTIYTEVAAGDSFSAAIKNDGTVIAWGRNDYGQCNVPSGLSGVKAIAAGSNHVTALKDDGTVTSWGSVTNNGLKRNFPDGLSKVKAISAGYDFSVALIEDGTVVAWSDNPYQYEQTTIPEDLKNVKAISAGYDHTLALKEDGTVVAWGYNYANQCNVPESLSDVKAVAAGTNYSLALKNDGTIVAWGSQHNGNWDLIPQNLLNITSLAAGGSHSLALSEDGTLAAWGYYTGGFQTGSPTSGGPSMPQGITNVKSISAGNNHSIILKQDGSIQCFGLNDFGQSLTPDSTKIRSVAAGNDFTLVLKVNGTVTAFGNNDYGQCSVPSDLSDVQAVATGYDHSVALKNDGTVVAWGNNTSYQCDVPPSLKDVKAIAAGYGFTLALKNDGTVIAWGDNYYGQCDIPDELSGVKAIAASDSHSAAINHDGSIVYWGDIGNGKYASLSQSQNYIDISVGYNFAAALSSDGFVHLWGDDPSSLPSTLEQLSGAKSIHAGSDYIIALNGNKTISLWQNHSEAFYLDPSTYRNVKQVAAGRYHAALLMGDGSLVGIGYRVFFIGFAQIPTLKWKKVFTNNEIYLGILSDNSLWQWSNIIYEAAGTESEAAMLTHPVKMLEHVTDVSIGNEGNILAVTEDKKLWTWGSNSYGQLGDNTTNHSSKPINIMDDVYRISGDYSTCFAIKNDNTLWGWGDNSGGQLGGDLPNYVTPKKIMDDVIDVASGPDYFMAIKTDNNLWGMGDNTFGQMCNISDSNSKPVAIMDKVKKIKIKYYSCYAIKSDNTLWTWGNNEYGQLGYILESDSFSNTPKRIMDNVNEGIKEVFASTQSAYALTMDNSLYSWGSNDQGQLGRVTEGTNNQPAEIMDFINDLSVSDSHVLALDTYGTLWGWGDNSDNQIVPRDTQSNIIEPTLITDNVIQFSTGHRTSSYIDADGYLFRLGRVNGYTLWEPEHMPVQPFIGSASLLDDTIEVQIEGAYVESVNQQDFYVNRIINGSSPQSVTFSVYDFDASTNTAIIKVPEIDPSDCGKKIKYTISYRGNMEVNTNEIVVSPVSSPTLTSPPTPTPSQSTTTPVPNSPVYIYTPQTGYPGAPSPEASETPVPSPTKASTSTPEPVTIISASDYNKKITTFKDEVSKIVDQYKATSDTYNDMNEVLIRKAEKTIEDISLRRVKSVNSSVDINKVFILPQSQKAKEAKNDVEKILKPYIDEDIRDIRTRINILVEGTHKELSLNFNKDIVNVMKEKVDVKVSTNLGNVILYNENADTQLKNGLTISLAESKKTSPDIKNIKSTRVSMNFANPGIGILKKLSKKLGYELPYGSGNPEYSAIMHESDGNVYNMGGHEDLDYKILRVSTASAGDYFIVEDKKSFEDIGKESSEMKKAVEALASKGIISGRSQNSFDPHASISRSEFTSLIIKGLNLNDDNAASDFKDVLKTAWYYNVVSIACAEGIIAGYEDKTFRGSKVINKQEIVKICAATLNERIGYYYPKNLDKYLNFVDKQSIPQWAKKFVALGNREGIIVKKPDNSFKGTSSCTRGDAAIILYRLYKKL